LNVSQIARISLMAAAAEIYIANFLLLENICSNIFLFYSLSNRKCVPSPFPKFFVKIKFPLPIVPYEDDPLLIKNQHYGPNPVY